MRKRGLRDIAERPVGEQQRRQKDRLDGRHVVAEVHHRTLIGLALAEPLDEDVHAELLRRLHGREAEMRPAVDRQPAERLVDRA